MPLIQVHLNTAAPVELTEFHNQLSELIAQGIGKPEDYVMTRISANESLCFARSNEPAAYVEVKNIGNMTATQTSSLSQKICQAIRDSAGIPPDRVYIEFCNAKRHLWGWNSKTFAD